ncbi:MAG: winged helix-turn-helix transcriptional regulator [Actinobacteria bacterium]|nr:winged helix-turn-helix transcriptional regulator [Actinomycetota bacterium]
MSSQAMKSTIRVTKALADTQRVRILLLLAKGELCVCQIVEVLDLASSTVSKHLSLLSSAGLVDVRKDGRWAYYRLPEGDAGRFFAPLLEWLEDDLQGDELIERDARVLEEVLARDPEEVARNQRMRAPKA